MNLTMLEKKLRGMEPGGRSQTFELKLIPDPQELDAMLARLHDEFANRHYTYKASQTTFVWTCSRR